MTIPKYEIIVSEDRLRYEFVSIGPRGKILKVVEYMYLESLDLWNLGFGDYEPISKQIIDDVITDNGDGRQVLATVVATLIDFFKVYSTETVIFTGSDERRTLLYNRVVMQYRHDFGSIFAVTGLTLDGIEQGLETGRHYPAFIIRKANENLPQL